jgi:cytochrome c biogenesis protein CcdA
MILGLVLIFRSRKKILLLGGTFILTTAVVYGLLIVLWYKFFSLLTLYVRPLELVIGSLATMGGLFFLRQFIRFKKYGPSCGIASEGSLISRASVKLKQVFQKESGVAAMVLGILLFSAMVAIVEFPCSAAIPVVFAGILSKAQIPGLLYFLYIGLFVFFYMLDEIIVFLIAALKMRLWLTSPKFTTWAVLIEAVILLALGAYYIIGVA